VAILPFLAETDLYNAYNFDEMSRFTPWPRETRESELYNAYNFDEPWDGPHNRKLLDKMPAVYRYPGMKGANPTYTAFFVFTGPDTLLGKGDKPDVADARDETSFTILAVEARREVPWTKPEDIPFDRQGPLPQVGGFTSDGFNALQGDGSVRYFMSLRPSSRA
jgi:hypothetical protein